MALSLQALSSDFSVSRAAAKLGGSSGCPMSSLWGRDGKQTVADTILSLAGAVSLDPVSFLGHYWWKDKAKQGRWRPEESLSQWVKQMGWSPGGGRTKEEDTLRGGCHSKRRRKDWQQRLQSQLLPALAVTLHRQRQHPRWRLFVPLWTHSRF